MSSSDAGPDAAPRGSGPCADRDPQRQVLFGDLHVHTEMSFDAYTYGVRGSPRDAYRFARGAAIDLAVSSANKDAERSYKLARPLDFAAVTDHADYLGAIDLCTVPGQPEYESTTCKNYRELPFAALLSYGLRLQDPDPERLDICGKNGARCTAAAARAWKRTGEAAEESYDRSVACRFTTFHAYEWSAFPGGANLHRNVIFKSDEVPDQPVGYFDEATPEGLWKQLERHCLDAKTGCDAVVIPHNSNLSRGKMFLPQHSDGTELTRADATFRSRIEPLVEITQHKGESECSRAFAPNDELCSFEKYVDAKERLSYVRGALGEGLRVAAKLGANPFKLGLIGSTDNHNAIPGATEENRFVGAFGTKDDTDEKLVSDSNIKLNPGGLAAVWAEENTRESIFAALRRREVYGTSGTRIVVRFFGGWSYDKSLCDSEKLVATGYRDGVPMGGDLKSKPASAKAPVFVVSAMKDPGTTDLPGTQLERIQIVKGWLDSAGKPRQKVYDVAGRERGATVDLASCKPRGSGADALCAVWSDPDFDTDERAFYYARVVENPSCRWQTWICVRRKVDCDSPPPALEGCCSSKIPKTIQERAWTSPIWYAPAAR